MLITVNEEVIEYTLEGEKNLYEVLGGLNRWLAKYEFVLSSASCNGTSVDLALTAQLTSIGVEEIDRIDVQARPAAQVDHEDIQTMQAYFRRVREAVASDDGERLRECAGEFTAARDNVVSLLERFSIPTDQISIETFDSTFASQGLAAGRALAGAEKSVLLAALDKANTVLDDRLREITAPKEVLAEYAGKIRESAREISDVSILLQTGKDREAMDAVIGFVELSSKLVRLYTNMRRTNGVPLDDVAVEGVAFSDFYVEFNGLLSELIDAFSANDSVLIGDLLEYEVAPRLEKLVHYVDLLINYKNVE